MNAGEGGVGVGSTLNTGQNSMMNTQVNIHNRSANIRKPKIRSATKYDNSNTSNELDPEARTGKDSGGPKSKDDVPEPNGNKNTSHSYVGSTMTSLASYDPKLAGLFGPSNTETMYRARKASQLADDPRAAHQAATGRMAPVSAQLGYNKTLPLVAMLMALKSPRLAAMLTGASMVGKQVYEMSNPTQQYQDVAYAKGMDNPSMLQRLFGGRKYNEAKQTTMPQSRIQKLLNLG